MRKTILIPINQGFAFRYFMQTDIFTKLQKSGHQIVILVPDTDDSFLEGLRQYENVVLAPYHMDNCHEYIRKSRMERFLKNLRLFVQNGHYNIRTVEDICRTCLEGSFKGKKRSNVRRIKDLVFGILINSARRCKLLRECILWIEHTLFSPPIHSDIFKTFQPDLLVVSSLGTLDYDQFLMREARSRKIPVVSVVLSWDNTTTRGMPGAIPDHVVAWTENMKRELIELNDIPAKKVFVGGVAHFDHYYREDSFLSKEKLFEQLELNIEKKILFLVTKSPNCYPWNADIAEMILRAIRENRFVEPCQLVVRLHPIYFRRQNGRFTFQYFLDRYDTLKQQYNELVINKPIIASNDFNYSMPKEEINLLATILKHSSSVINMFSTMNLEASIFDIPIVNVCFEGNSYTGPTKARHNIAMDEAQTHNQRVVKTGGVIMVRDESQLIEGVNKSLQEPGSGREGRGRIKKEECGPSPGYAGGNIANYILGLLEEKL